MLPREADAIAPCDDCDGAPKNAQVEPQRSVLDVPNVKREAIVPAEGVPAVDLGPTGEARAHFVASGFLCGVSGEVRGGQRSGTDEAHLAAQHVPQLGKFVKARGAQPTAEPREALLIREERAVLVARVGHGAELEDFEWFTTMAEAFVAEEHR